MKYEKEFMSFLQEDININYYYEITSINIVKGSTGNFYEIHIKNASELEDKSDIIIERFMYYLDEKGINYDVETLYHDMSEYLEVYDNE